MRCQHLESFLAPFEAISAQKGELVHFGQIEIGVSHPKLALAVIRVSVHADELPAELTKMALALRPKRSGLLT